MKCQKCSKPAVIHLTEIITDPIGGKRAVEMHLCLGHAAEAGIIAPGSELLPQVLSAQADPHPGKKSPSIPPSQDADIGLPTAIVPNPSSAAGGLTVTRAKPSSPEPPGCPVCGLTWSTFKQYGLMGCPHDYTVYESKLLPLLKRAQEGATDHVGKIPQRKKTIETDRQVSTLRIRRELQKAIDAENYEQAARLRDQLRHLEHN